MSPQVWDLGLTFRFGKRTSTHFSKIFKVGTILPIHITFTFNIDSLYRCSWTRNGLLLCLYICLTGIYTSIVQYIVQVLPVRALKIWMITCAREALLMISCHGIWIATYFSQSPITYGVFNTQSRTGVSGNSCFRWFPGIQASNFPSLPVAFCNFPSRSREKEVLAGN